MSRLKISRRTVIKGAGTVSIALPWLEAMTNGRPAHAQSSGVPLKRFVTIYQPGGTVRLQHPNGDQYTPTGTETSFTMSTILKPLEPVKSRLLIVDGLNLACADQNKYSVEQHQGGSVGWLTGGIQPGAGNMLQGWPSIDQVLATKLSPGKPFGSLQFAIRWATGKSHGKLHPINAMFFQNVAPNGPIPPRIDPQDIFTTLFGTPMGGSADTLALMRKKSILDYVDKKYSDLKMKLGTDDRARLDQHLTQLRDLESRISMTTTTPPPAMCKYPAKVDTTGYNPSSGLMADNDGKVVDSSTDMKIPLVGTFMMDMLVMALACDKTGVASLQWTDTEAKHTFPWLNLPEHHHFYQHDGGFRPAECTTIDVWYSQQHAYLLQKMQSIDMGGHSLLDESVVFFGSELSHPPTHTKTNMPFLLAGGDGKTMRTGRWITANNLPHNKLLTSILNLYGDTRTSFGDSRIDSAALKTPSLT